MTRSPLTLLTYLNKAQSFRYSATSSNHKLGDAPLTQSPESPRAKRRPWRWLWRLGGGLTACIFLPILFLYLRGAFRDQIDYSIENVPNLSDPRFPVVITGLADALGSSGRLTGFWVNSEAIYAARLEAIRQAQRTIHFETYFMTPGQRADDFAAAIAERAKSGVRVKLLVDHQGTSSIPDAYWQQLRQSGAEVNFFREFSWKAPLEYNSRTHRKLLLIDGQHALIGGAGVSDKWDGNPDQGDVAPWLEFEVRYEGPIASLLEGNFRQNWVYAGGTIDLSGLSLQPASDTDSSLFVTDDTSTLNASRVRLLFHTSFLAAEQRIWLGSPYFLPDDNTRNLLIEARNQGIDVRVLTMGRRNDKPLAYVAARELYGDLLSAGVQICEYQPSMMHAKLALIDNGWVSTGSSNFDPRSFFHNDELNISTSNPQLIAQIDRFFETSLTDSHCLDQAEWQNRSWQDRILGRLALIFHNLL